MNPESEAQRDGWRRSFDPIASASTCEVDHRAEDRCFAQEQAVGGAECVDAGGDERFDRVGCGGAAGDAGAHEFEEEQRIGDAPIQQVVEVVVVEVFVGGDGGASEFLRLGRIQ